MDGSCGRGFRQQPLWILGILVLMLGQAALALPVFGGRTGLLDERPILDGRHPLHLYHAGLGAETFRQRYATACYDPNFQAGYPKTPVFDSGCRPAEFFLVVGGALPAPTAYKLGLFICCVMVPAVYVVASRGAGLSRASSCLAGAVGSVVWWSPPVRAMFDAGDIDLLLAGLCGIVFLGWLPRYHWEPGITSWCVLSGTAMIGWYAHPVVWLTLAPIIAIYYLALAPRHGLAWHLGLGGITGVGISPNLWWLWDWGKFWWLRQPSVDDIAPLPTWGAILGTRHENAALLGETALGWPLVVMAAAGMFWMLHNRQRTTPMMFLLAGLSGALIARLGQVWPTMMAGGTSRAAPLVSALAVIPAASLIAAWWDASRCGRTALMIVTGLPAFLAVGASWSHSVQHAIGMDLHPLMLGVTDEQEQLAEALVRYTTPDARILIEDGDSNSAGWNWTTLLPEMTKRVYIGGLDPEACFEHAFCGMRYGRLNGRLIQEWSDAELTEFCRRYNVGWIVCRSQSTVARWKAYPPAREIGRFHSQGDVILFAIERPRSFLLTGSANLVVADRKKVILTDVMPVNSTEMLPGEPPFATVVLSLHYQDGLRISPGVVGIERDPDPYDPIPMIRLRMPGPMSRIVLTWENP